MIQQCFSDFNETGYYDGVPLKYIKVRDIPWFDGKPPVPGPFCGIRKELCPSEKASEELSREYLNSTCLCFMLTFQGFFKSGNANERKSLPFGNNG